MGTNQVGTREVICEVCRDTVPFNDDRARSGRMFDCPGDGTYSLVCNICLNQGYAVNHDKVCIFPDSPADKGTEEENYYPYIKGMNAAFNPWSSYVPRDPRGTKDREYGLRGYYRNKYR